MPVEKPDLLIQVLEKCMTCGGTGRIEDTTGHPSERISPTKPCPAHCENGYRPRQWSLVKVMIEMVTAAVLADYPQLKLLRGASLPVPGEEPPHVA